MQFLPLAMASMSGEGVCVAGIDTQTGQWVRPVVARCRCLFEGQSKDFEWNHYHDLRIGHRQARSSDVDPLGHHTEDYILIDAGPRVPIGGPEEKATTLERVLDDDLGQCLASGQRSLFLAKPVAFDYWVDDQGKARFKFMHVFLPEEDAPKWRAQRIACSRSGIPCTCPRWQAFVRDRWPNSSVSEGQLDELDPTAELYTAISLSALHKDAYWLIVAGVHVVGRDRIWL